MGHRIGKTTAAVVVGLVAALALPAAADPFDHGILWRLERGGSAPSYVFGILHSADPRVVALPHQVARAFARSRVLAIEVYLRRGRG